MKLKAKEIMKKTYIAFKLSCLLLLTPLVGCNDFDEINTNPDTSTEASASLLCTGVILQNLKFNGRDAKAFLSPNGLSKYIAYANESQMAMQYNNIGTGSFGAMTILQDIDRMVNYAIGTPMEDSYRGIAKFSRAYLFYNLTMQMGDMPYSESNQGTSGNYHPKYDEQKSILIGILNELKEADTHFSRGVTFTGDPTPFAGDPAKWRKASNSFALRVLISLSKKDSDTDLQIKTRFAEIVTGGFLLTASDSHLGLAYNSVNQHPLAGTNDLFTSRTVITSSVIEPLKELNDRRLFYFAEPSSKKIGGGLTASDMNAYVGVDASLDYSSMTANYLTGDYSLLNQRYLKNYASEPRLVVTFAEQQLILAEARVLNWITTGTAENYYKEGVSAALTIQKGTDAQYAHGMAIDQNYINNYFVGNAAFKPLAADQLKQIWTQRYLLNFLQDPYTSYYEYRRNGFPVFPIDQSTNLNVDKPSAIPVRWKYPSSESDVNRAKLEEALKRQFTDGYDGYNELMWILK